MTDDSAALDVLVVDDDPDTRENLRDILELDQYGVVMAATAAEALDRGDWPRFSAIILDRRLPDATAEQILPLLKERAPEAAVIVVTGYADLQGAIAALRQGAADYILKPLNADALRASLLRVAERRRLALAKERSEAAFRSLVEAAECMIVMLRPDRAACYFSPFAEQLTGYGSDEVLGHDFFELFLAVPERREFEREFIDILGGRPVRGYEMPVGCRDGSRRWMVWSARRLVDYEGSAAVLAVGQDITNLKRAQEQALQAGRLAAIGQMMTGLAHESRNALQRSQACLEMLALTVGDRPESLRLIDRLQNAQDHLHHLYEDVRGYAAPIALEWTVCDLAAVWREAWSHLAATRAVREATLKESVDSTPLTCRVDQFRIGQVFRNIFENALAACPSPIAVEVHASEARHEGRDALAVVVRDNGPGLGPEERRQVFEPFYTTKARGTGLGMAIVKRIVEAHGGQIAVVEDDTRGAAFLIILPRGLP